MTKRFEAGIEISKLLITVSSATIVGVAAFIDKVYKSPNEFVVFFLIVGFLFAQFVSIVSGIWHVGALLNSIEKSEENPDSFESIHDNKTAVSLCKWQQISFIVAVCAFVISIAYDRIYFCMYGKC